ncbi:MAG: hypothetical protein EOO65_02070 [Methanosarcinales archaeon]|nr:MAG: hypothetical protein EOO65_02070 [Methanosarcinales archaeon]
MGVWECVDVSLRVLSNAAVGGLCRAAARYFALLAVAHPPPSQLKSMRARLVERAARCLAEGARRVQTP